MIRLQVQVSKDKWDCKGSERDNFLVARQQKHLVGRRCEAALRLPLACERRKFLFNLSGQVFHFMCPLIATDRRTNRYATRFVPEAQLEFRARRTAKILLPRLDKSAMARFLLPRLERVSRRSCIPISTPRMRSAIENFQYPSPLLK
jgi:hypothetical protein